MDFCPLCAALILPHCATRTAREQRTEFLAAGRRNLPGILQLRSQVHAIIPPHAEMDGYSELSFPLPSLLGPHPISIESSKLFLFLHSFFWALHPPASRLLLSWFRPKSRHVS